MPDTASSDQQDPVTMATTTASPLTTPSTYLTALAALPAAAVYPDISAIINNLTVIFKVIKLLFFKYILQPSDRNNYAQLLQISMLRDFVDVRDLITFSPTQAVTYGVPFSDFIQECTFDRTDCSNQSSWTPFYSQQFGQCFTFTNGDGWFEGILDYEVEELAASNITRQYGSWYGLQLTMNVHADKYIGMLAQSAGARIVVHNIDQLPTPEANAVFARPGEVRG